MMREKNFSIENVSNFKSQDMVNVINFLDKHLLPSLSSLKIKSNVVSLVLLPL
jgi:hypothetical protein